MYYYLLAICFMLVAPNVAQNLRWFAPELNCWITQQKVPATWEDAQRNCQINGEILASPLNTQLFEYMKTLINVHNNSAAYFIGTRANYTHDDHTVQYVSIEGKLLNDMPKAVFDEIDKIDLTQGDCLSLDRYGIRAVSCWDRLPYICYSNETTECGFATAPTTTTTTLAPTITTTPAPTTTTTTPTTTTTTTTPTTTTTTTTPTTTTTTTTPAPTTTTTTPTTTTTRTTTTTPTTPPSPPGYTYAPATGSYYKFHNRQWVSWYEARDICASEGAHVVVLNNGVEAAFVAALGRATASNNRDMFIWTGLCNNRPGGVNDWRTIHGDPQSQVYTMWRPNWPTNSAASCALFSNLDKTMINHNHNFSNFDLSFTCEISPHLQ